MSEHTTETDQTPLRRIQGAERLIRERANVATPGRWYPLADEYEVIGDSPISLNREGDDFETVSMDHEPNRAHIATWDTTVALAVADWLRTAAMDLWAHGPLCCPTGCDDCDDSLWMPHVRRALTLADLVVPPGVPE